MLERIEREFLLIARHHIMANRSVERPQLERSAYLLLNRLQASGPMSIGQLADAFVLDTSTVNRQVAALVRGRLAERIADPDGGLARKLRLTDLGREKLAADRDSHCRGLERVLADWSPQDRRELLEVLVRFNQAVERRQGVDEWPRPELAPHGASAGGGLE